MYFDLTSSQDCETGLISGGGVAPKYLLRQICFIHCFSSSGMIPKEVASTSSLGAVVLLQNMKNVTYNHGLLATLATYLIIFVSVLVLMLAKSKMQALHSSTFISALLSSPEAKMS